VRERKIGNNGGWVLVQIFCGRKSELDKEKRKRDKKTQRKREIVSERYLKYNKSALHG
jgi:hypothetical protein